jgi:hypothetical protein
MLRVLNPLGTCNRSTIFPFVAARAQALMVFAAFCFSSKLIEAAEALKFIYKCKKQIEFQQLKVKVLFDQTVLNELSRFQV